MAEIPTPPENPFESAAPHLNAPQDSYDDGEMASNAPGVAANKSKGMIVLGLVGAVILFLLYNIFFADSKRKVDDKPKKIEVAKQKDQPIPLPLEPELPVQPEIKITAPVLPPAPTVPVSGILNPIAPEEDAAAKAQAQARMRSNMVIADGASGGGLSALTGQNAPTPASNDQNLQFAANLANTKAETVQATRIRNLSRTIAQGRIIQATMESALNTDLPAPIRAIVSRDVYAEAGTVPLIPKGSRLIGSYNTSLLSGQTRVFVVWTRVIRPDGVDVMLGSPLVDAIGQAGITGQVDTKFQEIFARSILASAMNIAMAIASDEISGGSTTTSNTGNGSTTTGDAATTATTNALNRLGAVTDGFIQKFLNVGPTILIDQGTPVNVFVNKDLVFPEDYSGARIIN